VAAVRGWTRSDRHEPGGDERQPIAQMRVPDESRLAGAVNAPASAAGYPGDRSD
jgi:hypothetical protein